MRKFAIAFAALAAFGIAMPLTSSAKAEDAVVIKKDGDRDHDRVCQGTYNLSQFPICSTGNFTQTCPKLVPSSADSLC